MDNRELADRIAACRESYTHPGTSPRGFPNGQVPLGSVTLAEQAAIIAALRAAPAEREPTEKQCAAVRGILQILRNTAGTTYLYLQNHCFKRGDNMLLWPKWALTDYGYVTESGAAALIYSVMQAAGAGQGVEQEKADSASVSGGVSAGFGEPPKPFITSPLSARSEARASERRQGHSALRGKPLDDDGAMKLETFDPHAGAAEGLYERPRERGKSLTAAALVAHQNGYAAGWADAREAAENIAARCSNGAAIEIDDRTYPLGIMANAPAEAQALTAVAIAAVITTLSPPSAGGGK